jgi:hypothetical protein
LKAIDECGSPSEINEQYLESEELDESEVNDTFNSTKIKKSFFQNKISEISPPKSSPMNNISSIIGSFQDHYKRVPLFTLFRIISVMIYLSALLILAGAPPYPSYPYFQDGYYLYRVLRILRDYVAITIIWCILFTFLEGLIIHKWKNRLVNENFNRKIDDKVIINLSRIGFLFICLKTSVLPIPEYLILVAPVPLICLILLERRFRTQFWVRTVSPTLLKVANNIEEGNLTLNISLRQNKFFQMFQGISITKKVYLISLATFFLLSLFLPMYGWEGLIIPIVSGYEPFIQFYPRQLNRFVAIWPIFMILFLLVGILLNIQQKDDSKESVFSYNAPATWLVRIFSLRTIFFILTYNQEIWLFRYLVIVIPLYLLFELLNVRSVNSPIISALRYFGESNYKVKRTLYSPSSLKSSVNTEEKSISSQTKQNIASTDRISSTPKEVTEIPKKEKSLSFLARFRNKTITILKRIILATVYITKRIAEKSYLPLRSTLKALFVTIFLLVGSIVEIFLILFSMLTAVSSDGSVRLPIYTFDLGFRIIETREIIIWNWYVIGILAAQIFILVLIEWYLYITHHSEGFLILFFRNLSRIIFVILYFGNFIQISQGDQYAPLRLFLLIVLLLFSEITALKIRLERKKWTRIDDSQTNNRVIDNQGSHISRLPDTNVKSS